MTERFSCCSSYKECSEALKCLHKDDEEYAGCNYRLNLEDGLVFYGSNKSKNCLDSCGKDSKCVEPTKECSFREHLKPCFHTCIKTHICTEPERKCNFRSELEKGAKELAKKPKHNLELYMICYRQLFKVGWSEKGMTYPLNERQHEVLIKLFIDNNIPCSTDQNCKFEGDIAEVEGSNNAAVIFEYEGETFAVHGDYDLKVAFSGSFYINSWYAEKIRQALNSKGIEARTEYIGSGRGELVSLKKEIEEPVIESVNFETVPKEKKEIIEKTFEEAFKTELTEEDFKSIGIDVKEHLKNLEAEIIMGSGVGEPVGLLNSFKEAYLHDREHGWLSENELKLELEMQPLTEEQLHNILPKEFFKPTYEEFLHSKIELAPDTGFEVNDSEINPVFKPHQRDAIRWAILGGRRALFEAFGLGKTGQELEICRIITEHEGGKALIVLPLGVKQEFIRDAVELLHIEAPQYVRTMEEVRKATGAILITNYERIRDGDIDPTYFTVTCLDEASVLRSFGSKTYQTFLEKFKGVRYKFVATATPSPNKFKELIHYAGYLEIMDTGQALTRFFQRDSTKANHLTLYSHKEEEFWLWASSWALFITKPSDLGYDDTGYDLPPLDIRYHEISNDYEELTSEKNGQLKLIRDASVSLQDAAREKNNSIPVRVRKMAEIVNESPQEHYILWHDLEAERLAIKKALPETVDIYGSQDIEIREKRVIDFSEGKFRLFATKKELSGSGCNFQRHCHRAIFLGIDYEFNDFIQAIHRIYRFLQTEKVIIDIIYTENERNILKALLEKWKQHDYLTEKMTEIIKKYGLSNATRSGRMSRSIGVERVRIEGQNYTAINNDCILETKTMEPNSIDLIVTSIPFSNHYEYTPSYNDLGHNADNDRFFEQMDYLTPELLRILRPGRIAAVHVKDRILFGNATGTGMPEVDPFSEFTTLHFMKHGFRYMGRITVVTDVVRENNQTYRLGWTEQCKDGSKMGVGCPEYILLFRKLPTDRSTAYADAPVAKTKDEYTRAQWQIDAHAFWRTSGNRYLTKEELQNLPVNKLQAAYRKYSRENVYDYQEHVELAKKLDTEGKLPASFMVVAPGSWTDEVWDDINRMKTLNTSQSNKRQQLHVCPFQIEIVERLINRYSNSGDMVFDPFAGLFTVPQQAVKLGRKGIGIELNPDYFRDGLGYLKAEEAKAEMPTLFDFLTDDTEPVKEPEPEKEEEEPNLFDWEVDTDVHELFGTGK